jgi:hypothetical protein
LAFEFPITKNNQTEMAIVSGSKQTNKQTNKQTTTNAMFLFRSHLGTIGSDMLSLISQSFLDGTEGQTIGLEFGIAISFQFGST